MTNNLSTGVAFIKGSDNSCAGEIVLVDSILPLIGNILQCINILLLDAHCLPLGKDIGPFSFEFDVHSLLGNVLSVYRSSNTVVNLLPISSPFLS